MQRRTLAVAALALLLLALPASAQRAHRVGSLTISPRDTQGHLIEAFEQRLAERGYAERLASRFRDGFCCRPTTASSDERYAARVRGSIAP